MGKAAPVHAEQLLYRTTSETGKPLLAVTTVISPLVPLGLDEDRLLSDRL